MTTTKTTTLDAVEVTIALERLLRQAQADDLVSADRDESERFSNLFCAACASHEKLQFMVFADSEQWAGRALTNAVELKRLVDGWLVAAGLPPIVP